jgi:DNA polymerase III subunit epsilon
MILSQEYERIYNEIRLLMQAELYEAANHAIPELMKVAVTMKQIVAAHCIEDFLIEKLDESLEALTMLQNFKEALKNQNYLILDTETTGLEQGEVVQIAIINSQGQTLLDTLVQPKCPIPRDATAIHGISDEMCKDAPTWLELAPKIQEILKGQALVVYNATYDRKIMHQTAERWEMTKIEWKEIAEWHCAMEAFAEFYGDWNEYRGNYRWQKLITAASHCNVQIAGAHSALGDCLMTLGVVKAMLKQETF